MNLAKTIRIAFALILLAAGKLSRAEEEHSITTALNSTTLNGYVDTSGSWWIGGHNNDYVNDPTIVVNNNVFFLSSGLTTSTLEPGEPTRPGQTGSVWFRWTAQQTGVARISTNFIPALQAPLSASTTPALSEESIFYPGGGITLVDVTTGVIVTTLDPRNIGYEKWWTDLAVYRFVQISDTEARLDFVQRGASLQFDAQAGETFFVAIEVYQNQPAYEGQFELPSSLPSSLYFDLTPPPVNDSFSSALSIADSSGGFMLGYTLAATREPGEPDLGGAFSGASVWFHYTAATYGTVTIGSPNNTAPFAIFTGSAVSNLTPVVKSDGGAASFFAEEGKVYHVAVYDTQAAATGFFLGVAAPKYRLYETNLDALFPNSLTPHFYGVRGVTMLSYAKSATGWDLIEVEPIVDQAADLLIRPTSAVDGKLRVITIDEPLPSPHVIFSTVNGVLTANLAGVTGQTCAVSYSTDLVNWSSPQVITLQSASTFLRVLGLSDSNYFFRITQSLPLPPATMNSIGVHQQTGEPGDIPTPPVPNP